MMHRLGDVNRRLGSADAARGALAASRAATDDGPALEVCMHGCWLKDFVSVLFLVTVTIVTRAVPCLPPLRQLPVG